MTTSTYIKIYGIIFLLFSFFLQGFSEDSRRNKVETEKRINLVLRLENTEFVCYENAEETELFRYSNAEKAINHAFRLLKGKGGSLHFSPGDYHTGPLVLMGSNVILTGSGDSSRIILKDGTKGDILRLGDAKNKVTEVTIRNINLNGNIENAEPVHGLRLRGDFWTVDRVLIDGVTVSNVDQSGIAIDSATYTTVANSRIENARIGVRLESVGRAIVSNNQILRSSTAGFQAYASGASVFTGNVIEGGPVGVSIVDGSENTVSGNTLVDLRDSSIAIFRKSSFNTITGNTIMTRRVSKPGEFGILIDRADNNTISGNTVSKVERPIYFRASNQEPPNSNLVVGNTLNPSGGAPGVRVAGRENSIFNNSVSGSAESVENDGTDSSIKDNRVVD